jgi:hypothetical protein
VLCWTSASLTIQLTTFLVKACVAVLLKSLELQVTPELPSPIYSRSLPARSSCVRCPLVQTGDGITTFNVHSTFWRGVPSLIISVGTPA